MTHVATVTIDSGKVPSSLTDFVVYIDLSDLLSSFWDTVANGGGDIRCYKSDGTTELAREVVSCDTSGETGELWVKYSGTLSSTIDTDIQIHADGVSSDYAVSATFGRNAAFSDYDAVWHMADLSDSTGNGNDLTMVGSPTSGSGPIGSAYDLDGVNDYFTVAHSSSLSLDLASDFTIQTVTNSDGASAGLVDKTAGNDDAFKLIITIDQIVRGRAPDTGNLDTGSGGYPINTDAWLAWTHDDTGNDNRVLIQGAEEAIDATANFVASANTDDIHIGNDQAFDARLNGVIDEVRIASVFRSNDWIATEYANQSSPSTFYSVTDIGGATTLVAAFASRANNLL